MKSLRIANCCCGWPFGHSYRGPWRDASSADADGLRGVAVGIHSRQRGFQRDH